jgi:hypothetical protein
MNSS